MKARKPLSIEALAKIAGLGVDEVLLKLWEGGIEYVNDGKSVVHGQHLLIAKRILGVPVTSQLTALSYWQSVLALNEKEIRALLNNLKVPMSDRAIKLPKGAIKKLKAEIRKQNKTLQPVQIESKKIVEEVVTDFIPWTTIGRKSDFVSIVTVDEVLRIHDALVIDFLHHYDPINPPGIKDSDLLQSAVFRQETSIGPDQKYQSVEMKGAALLHSLIHNHPFHNGNKRTALVSLIVFLDKNQRMFICKEDDLFRFVLTVAQHRIVKGSYIDLPDREVIAIAEWIRDNIRTVEFGEKVVSFRKMKPILNRYGCDINHSDGGTNIKVTRKKKNKTLFGRDSTLTCNFSVRNDGEELQLGTIKKIREELELDEEHGIDSAAFYEGTPTAVGDFIVKYRKTLIRLAKL